MCKQEKEVMDFAHLSEENAVDEVKVMSVIQGILDTDEDIAEKFERAIEFDTEHLVLDELDKLVLFMELATDGFTVKADIADENIIGKYAVFFNGCFAPRRDLKIVDADGGYITVEWDGKRYAIHLTDIAAIIDNQGDEF